MFDPLSDQEPGAVLEKHDWHVEGIAEADQACGLITGIGREHTGLLHRLAGDDSDAGPVNPGQSRQEAGPELRLQLEPVAGVCQLGDHRSHVVDATARTGY